MAVTTAQGLPPADWPITEPENNKITKPWYGYFKGFDDAAREDLATATTATSYAKTILAATTSATARTVLGVDAADTTGSWTPGIAISGTTIASAPSVAVGKYTQTASGMVHAWGTLTITTKGATTGPLTLTGLPIRASSTTAGIKYSGSIGHISGLLMASTNTGLTCYVTTGSTVVTLEILGDSLTGNIAIPSTRLSTAGSISVYVNYETSL